MENTDPALIHQLDNNNQPSFSFINSLLIIIVVLLFGIFSGLLLSKIVSSTSSSLKSKQEAKVIGIKDKKTFKDSTEGILKEGGIDGEGNYHLERPGGSSQNAYLTSSTVDLSQFVGKKVRVWGETFQGEKAGWLMDVGLVEILQ